MLTLLWKDCLSILKCLMIIVIKSLNLLDVCEIKTEFERCFAFSHLRLDNKTSQQNILLNTGLSVEGVFVIYMLGSLFLSPEIWKPRLSCWFQSSKQHQKLLAKEFQTLIQQSLLLNNKICLYKQQYLFSKCIFYFFQEQYLCSKKRQTIMMVVVVCTSYKGVTPKQMVS